VARSGNASGQIAALSDGQSFGSLTQSVRADSLRGKRVRFTAWVKTREVGQPGSQNGASLWMRVDGGGGSLGFDNMSTRSVRGTSDWTRHSIVLDVPDDAVGILLGMLLNSTGDAWVDDATLEIVDTQLPTTNTMPASRDASRSAQQREQFAALPLDFRNLDFERVR